MRLTLHIVRKDLLRLRWILALWLVALTARMALAEIQAALDAGGYYPFYIMASVFGTIFLPLLSFGLVMGVVSDDSVADTDAFWITRPISGARLLSAKVVMLGLCCLVPVLVTAPWWIAHGFDLRQLGVAALQGIRWQVFLSLLALPFAVISINAGRFFLYVVMAAAVSFALLLAGFLFEVGPTTVLAPEVLDTATWVILALWAAATVAVTLVQFLTRRTRLSSALLVVAVLAGCVISRGWTWNLFPPAANPAAAASALTLKLGSATMGRGQAVQLEYVAAPPENGRIVTFTRVTHQLVWPNESVAFESSPDSAAQLTKACSALALGGSVESRIPSDLVLSNEAQRQRLLGEAPRYLAEITGEIRHPEITATLRPQTDAVSRRQGFRLKIAEVISNDFARGVVLEVHESMPESADEEWLRLFRRPRPAPAEEFYFFVNAAEGRAIAGRATMAGDSLAAGAIIFRRKVVVFPINQEEFNRWAPTGVLIKVAARDVTPFSVIAAVPRLEVTAASGAPATSATSDQ